MSRNKPYLNRYLVVMVMLISIEMSEYDFILESQASRPVSSMKQRFMVVGFGLVVLIIAAIFVFGVLLRPEKGPVDRYADVYLLQVDLAAIGTESYGQLRDPDVRQFTAGARALVESDKNKLIAVINSSGRSISKDELALSRDTNFRTTLTNAQATNTYDTVFREAYTAKLTAYAAELQSLYEITTNQDNRLVIEQALSNMLVTLDLN